MVEWIGQVLYLCNMRKIINHIREAAYYYIVVICFGVLLFLQYQMLQVLIQIEILLRSYLPLLA